MLPYHVPSRLDTSYGRHYETATGIWPGVTTILSATKDRSGLEAWEARVGAAEAERIRTDACSRGTWLHESVENKLLKQIEPDYHWVYSPWWNSVASFLPRVQSVLTMESAVSHPFYQYAGTIDLLATTDDGATTLIDWKTSGSRKKPAYLEDYRLQLGAYTQAVEQTYKSESIFIERGILVIALPDEAPQIVTLERDELDDAFAGFKTRLHSYWQQRLTPFQANV